MNRVSQQAAARMALKWEIADLRAALLRLATAESEVTLSKAQVDALKAWRLDMEAWREQARTALLNHEARIKALEGR